MADRSGDPLAVATAFSDHRHLVDDMVAGHSRVGDDDLLLFVDVPRNRLICLGPPSLGSALPPGFRVRGLGHWTPSGDAGLAMFRPRPVCVPCIAVRVRPGRPTGWGHLENALAEQADAHPSGSGLPGLRRDGARGEDARIAALVHFEIGRRLAEAADSCESELTRARSHLRHAAFDFRAACQDTWVHAAERCSDMVAERLFLVRQMQLPAPFPTGERERLRLRGMGLGIHQLALIPLPPLDLIPTDPRTARVPAAHGRRVTLCTPPLREAAARRLMPDARPVQLRGSVLFVGTDESSGNTPPHKLRLPQGATVTVRAILDGEPHSTFGLASRSRDADPVRIFADGGGLQVSPSIARGRVGHPVRFTVTATERGEHALRFVFLTRDRMVSKVRRTIEVTGTGERDVASAQRPFGEGEDRLWAVPRADPGPDA